ncbi:MAG: alpha/beta hydrolase [Pirellulaceae bacterium]|jgi:hypothetical protein|nr:alpha/beta hydrolase [Pirellulaceae bacterium]
MNAKATPPEIKRTNYFWRIARTLAAVYLGGILLLILLENWLVYPAPVYPRGDYGASLGQEEVQFASADGMELHGWLFEHPSPRGSLLYCHGNGENIAYYPQRWRDLSQRYRLNVLVFDYRGYGKSNGSPNEAGVLADGDAAQRWLANRVQSDPSDVIVMGRSLGGAVAIDVATQNGARALVLESTFTSMPEVAATHYWWAPVRTVMRNRYSSIDKIAAFKGPTLISHGDADEVVPYEHGRRLLDVCGGEQKRFLTLSGLTHNDPQPPIYYELLGEFLDELFETPADAEE